VLGQPRAHRLHRRCAFAAQRMHHRAHRESMVASDELPADPLRIGLGATQQLVGGVEPALPQREPALREQAVRTQRHRPIRRHRQRRGSPARQRAGDAAAGRLARRRDGEKPLLERRVPFEHLHE
jgi:hypothetical protein